MIFSRPIVLWAVATFSFSGAAALAQKPAGKKQAGGQVQELTTGKPAAAATVDRIMDQAVRNIAARYNLNDVQTEETGKLMRREVYRFLKEHENEIWPVIRDLLKNQLRTPENREEMMGVGKAARPLAKLAKEAIFRANEEWGAMLTPEQKRVHDFDLAEMDKTFEQIDTNFGKWESGEAEQEPIFPQPQLTGREPPRPPKPPRDLPDPPIIVWEPKKVFETLVEAFIEEYELDEGQITSARSILEEFQAKADNFRESKKLELEKVATEQQEAHRNRDLDAVKKADAARKKLFEPVYELVAQMDVRLKGLLTTAQIQRHAKKEEGKDAAKTPKTATVKKKTSSKAKAASAKSGPGKPKDASNPSPDAKSDNG